MRIIKLTLHKYKRLSLGEYSSISVSFTSLIQLVLGTNGSGKSSIIDELSPLPCSSSDLDTDGFKEIEIEHLNRHYILRNEKGSNSFVVDDEEYNLGGTLTVQKQLVFEHFNYSSSVHDLMTGKLLFTEMRPANRKDSLTYLSEVDYDYALSIYARVKEKHRDTIGALKHARHSLSTTVKENLDLDISALTSTLESKQSQLQSLLSSHLPIPSSDYTPNLERVYTDSVARLARMLNIHPLRHLDYLGSLTTLNAKYEHYRLIREDLLKRYSEVEVNYNEYLKSKQISSDEVDSDIVNITAKIDTLSKVTNPLSSTTDSAIADRVQTTLRVHLNEILAILDVFPSDTHYTQDTLAILTNKHKSLISTRDNTSKRIAILTSQLEEIDKSSVVCPECNTTITIMDTTKVESIRKEIETLSSIDVDSEIKSIANEIDDVSSYYSLVDRLKDIMRSTSILSHLWKEISDKKLISSTPLAARQLIVKYDNYLTNLIEIHQLERELTKLKENLSLSNRYSQQLGDKLKNELDSLDSKISENLTTLDRLSKEKEILNYHLDSEEKINHLRDEILKMSTTLSNEVDKRIYTLYQQYLDESISLLQIEIGKLSNTLHQASLHQSNIERLQIEIAMLEDDEIAYKSILNTLSPVDGLIALGLTGFIKHVIMQMNSIISNVWSYDMQILLPSNEDIDLDYKFSFKLGDVVVPDISLASQGQKEIFNFAYRIVATRYLHLNGIPIYADEFGRCFDTVHRQKALLVLKELLHDSHYTQLFMVSHYEDIHSSLTNAETLVLSSLNISTPTSFNQHAVFS